MTDQQQADVTVIIPTYNRLWSLPKAIDSCRKTTCITEIIVVDDGSTDGTWEWLQQQPDVRSFYQENQGQTYAANFGTNYATGKYIRFLDSDDFLVEGAIDKQFLKAEETNANLVYSAVDIYVESTGEVINLPIKEAWEDFLEIQLGNGNGSHYLGMLFSTHLVKKVPRRPDLSFRDDRMFLLEYALLDPKIVWAQGCAGHWVKHTDQMQANYQGLKAQVTNWQHLYIYKKILSKLAANGKLTQARKNAACTVLWPLAHWIAKDNISEGVEVVNWIYELNPDFQIPEPGTLGFMYRSLGFKMTEKLLGLRRLTLFR
ncbi:glycosyltransferase family 2 protein [Mucilaginibacter myungsuensis]|uniref:Glycosyltransferase family 2 protein n=1 Tax=Mucilaginibacter myungsuensis TaxID=649104 RepID=A0A929KSQ6_9SPHI|nr:glycosyltransferase family 2 protein [Mucilaginibacter myungsuensis]MBE9660834.1 glycosyltransferase family 2 protein [Mucilaginibacter myungsuensis]MDN3600881.1 glycosyltransferase family 2 protein [Mucilaginibacter myungsuensis]